MSRIEPRRGALGAVVAFGSRRIYGRDLEAVRVHARAPRLMAAWGRYNRATEKAPHLPKALAELGVVRAATMVGCEFCIDISSAYAGRAGLSDEQLLSLHDAHACALFDADQLMVIDLATGMSGTPAAVDDELFERLRARFGLKGTLELVQLIAWENSRARQNVALGLGAEGFTTGKACALPYTAAGIDSMSITKRNLTSPSSIRS
jgi:AhpD family alkylhydroperoxidase